MARRFAAPAGAEADRQHWAEIRSRYASIAAAGRNDELARTFFNSVTRRIFDTTGVDAATEFVDDVTVLPTTIDPMLYHEHAVADTTRDMLLAVLADHDLGARYAQRSGDVALAGLQIDNWLRNRPGQPPIERVQTLKSVFYRNKGCYIVGRVLTSGPWTPFVLALTHGKRGLQLDAVLMDQNDVSILFSFARSYFQVLTEQPLQTIAFLRSIMPLKPLAELYISLGFHKHGKAEIFRALDQYLEHSDDRFESAEIDKGMVMLVFGLPGYDLVFKVIRDHFAYPKKMTRREVRKSYELVFHHDRVGRLVDAQEFEQLRFRRDRFAPELLRELLAETGSTVEDDGETLTFGHLYTERRVTPLNQYLRQADRESGRRALLDYGRTIKELAAANIFPGDFLLTAGVLDSSRRRSGRRRTQLRAVGEASVVSTEQAAQPQAFRRDRRLRSVLDLRLRGALELVCGCRLLLLRDRNVRRDGRRKAAGANAAGPQGSLGTRLGRTRRCVRRPLDQRVEGYSQRPARRARRIRYDRLDSLPAGVLAGWHAEEYQVDLEHGWEGALDHVKGAQQSRCSGDVPGDTQRFLRVQNAISRVRWKHVLLPIWSIAYRYKEKTYTVLIHGQTGKVVGEAPYSWFKILGLAFAVIAAVLFTLLIAGVIGALNS